MRFLKPCVIALLTALCYAAPTLAAAQGQWVVTADTQHYSYTATHTPNVSELNSFAYCQIGAQAQSPAVSDTATATFHWFLTWSGGGTPSGTANPKCDLTINGNVASYPGTPSTATGVSDLDGDGGALLVNYPPSNSGYTKTYTLAYSAPATIYETVKVSFSSVWNGTVYGSASIHLP